MSEERAKELAILEKPAIQCADVDILISDYLDGELLPTTHARVTGHLNCCERCKENEEDMRLVINLAQTLQRVSIPRGVRTRLREKLNSSLGLTLPVDVE